MARRRKARCARFDKTNSNFKVHGRRVSIDEYSAISIKEESKITIDMLPMRSPFKLRFAPDVEYLNWRYSTELTFVRYRLFRVLAEGRTVGYIVINDGNRLMVAHCDGEDCAVLAYAILIALTEVSRNDRTPRHLFLSSCVKYRNAVDIRTVRL